MAFTDTWDNTFEAHPPDTDNVGGGADDIRDFKLAMRERIAQDHYMDPAGTDADHGEHKKVTLRVLAATPTNVANKAFIYVKDVSSKVELHFEDEDGNEMVITSAGRLKTQQFFNGTYTIDFPTNGMANAKFMLGNSSTIAWFYLNTAPPGWKVLATGADTVLGVAGGSQAYNVSGGSQAGTWTISGLTADSHTHSMQSHTHTLATGTNKVAAGEARYVYMDGGYMRVGTSGSNYPGITQVTGGPSTGSTGTASATGVSSGGAWRAAASVGKLFQLDTA